MKKPGKRIVSRAEYAVQVFRKYGLGIGSLSMVVAGLGLLMVGCIYLILFLNFSPGKHDPSDWDDFDYPLLLRVGIIGTVGGAACLCAAFFAGKRAGKLRVDVPITRANTADLPATDSLVRASEEPVQEPQTVLLRAAMTSEQTPVEQLVRPATGAK